VRRVGPPHYWKDRETKERKLLLVSGRADILWTSKIEGLQYGN